MSTPDSQGNGAYVGVGEGGVRVREKGEKAGDEEKRKSEKGENEREVGRKEGRHRVRIKNAKEARSEGEKGYKRDIRGKGKEREEET